MPDFSFDKKSIADTRFEDWLAEAGYSYIAGTDEAGRGPLAGPVVAAAVVLPRTAQLSGLNDSKTLNARKQEVLFDEIMDVALAVSVCAKSAETIDRTNIRRASLEAMRVSIASLSVQADCVLVDGRDIPPGLPPHLSARALVKGDSRSLSIAAASIIAKVSRDRMMERLGDQYADYGLSQHMGYGSEWHRKQILALGGVKRVHRFSFNPLKEMTSQEQ